MRSIAVDRGSDGVIAYAVANGAVYKTSDAGAHWRASSDGINGRISLLVIAPGNSSLLYAAGYPQGQQIFKSTDAGEHWAGLPGPPQSQGATHLAVSGNTLIVGNDLVVDRSDDDGQSWQRTFTSVISGGTQCCIYSLFAHPDGSVILVHQTVYRSTDAGNRWTALRSSPESVMAATMDTDGTIYVANLEGGTPGRYAVTIYRSQDVGATWTRQGSIEGPIRSIHATEGRLYVSRGCNPDEMSEFQICRNGLVRYEGSEWVEQSGFGRVAVQDVRQAGAARVFAATDGSGILTRTDEDPQWTKTNRGLPGPPVSSIAVSPRYPSVVYAVGAGGLLKTEDYATTWRLIGDAGWQYVAVSPVDRDVAYVAAPDGLKKTIDGGASFTVLRSQIAGNVAIAPSNPNTIYAALYDGMVVSHDAGLTWAAGNRGITTMGKDNFYGFSTRPPIVVDPNDDGTAYLARDEALYKTTNGGATWTPIRASTFSGGYYTGFWGHSMALDPFDSRRIYVTAQTQRGEVSHDGGSTWTASFPSIARELVFDPGAPDVLYAIENGQVFRSVDRGETFSPFSDGLEGVSVTAVTIDASGYFLYAATSHGVYSLERDRGPHKHRRSVRR